MADSRFFTIAGSFELGRIAEATGAVLADPSRSGVVVTDVAPIDMAGGTHLSFLDNKKYIDSFKVTKAAACFVRPELAALAPSGTVCLTHKNPYKAYALAAQLFYPAQKPVESRAASAVIDPTAVIGAACEIEAGVVIGKNVRIGARCRLQAHAVIRDGVEIGDDCDIGPHVTISHALIGDKVRLHHGVSVGRQGFGFAIDPAGFVAVPQLGRVIIESDVEIGANTTVDRGAGPDTVIGQGTRIDNLVQVAHNVQIGKYCIIAGQSGISGSTKLGDYVMLGGQSGLAGHLNVGQGARIAAQSGVLRDVPPGVEYMGTPAVPLRQNMRQVATLARLAANRKKGEDA